MMFIKRLILTFLLLITAFPFNVCYLCFVALKEGKFPDLGVLKYSFKGYCALSDMMVDALSGNSEIDIWHLKDEMEKKKKEIIHEFLTTKTGVKAHELNQSIEDETDPLIEEYKRLKKKKAEQKIEAERLIKEYERKMEGIGIREFCRVNELFRKKKESPITETPLFLIGPLILDVIIRECTNFSSYEDSLPSLMHTI